MHSAITPGDGLPQLRGPDFRGGTPGLVFNCAADATAQHREVIEPPRPHQAASLLATRRSIAAFASLVMRRMMSPAA
jgi:hypothetical protein